MSKRNIFTMSQIVSRPEMGAESARLWCSFIRDRRWSRMQKRSLLEHFDGLSSVYQAVEREIDQVIGTKRRSRKSCIDDVMLQKDLLWITAENHQLITWFDSRYPSALREINDPPVALFAAGDLTLLDKPKVAIVGSRKPTPAGERAATQISSSLSSLGVAIVSGLAFGIDAVAHKASLSVNGPSIAVVGCGIDVVYPARHRALYRKMHDNGLILSEYPLGFAPSKYTFPDRNRLVSGLSSGVVIVEAAEKSGTLITARLAIEQNRELMVVPGPAISAQYAGSHRLLKDGAALVCNSDDVLELLFTEMSQFCDSLNAPEHDANAQLGLNKRQLRVFDALSYEPCSIDYVTNRAALAPEETVTLLLELELNGMVATTPEGGYIRTQ